MTTRAAAKLPPKGYTETVAAAPALPRGPVSDQKHLHFVAAVQRFRWLDPLPHPPPLQHILVIIITGDPRLITVAARARAPNNGTHRRGWTVVINKIKKRSRGATYRTEIQLFCYRVRT